MYANDGYLSKQIFQATYSLKIEIIADKFIVVYFRMSFIAFQLTRIALVLIFDVTRKIFQASSAVTMHLIKKYRRIYI